MAEHSPIASSPQSTPQLSNEVSSAMLRPPTPTYSSQSAGLFLQGSSPGIISTTTKLDDGNYTIWKRQILTAIIADGFEDFISRLSQPPPLFLGPYLHNPTSAYKQWQRTDKSIMSMLFTSLTSGPLAEVVSSTTAVEVWSSLQARYESTSTARIVNLRLQMQQLKKDGLTMHQYLAQLKSYSNHLLAVGELVCQKDYIWYMLEGLPAEYDPIAMVVFSRPDQPSVEDVHSILHSFDLRLEKRLLVERILPKIQHKALHPEKPRHYPDNYSINKFSQPIPTSRPTHSPSHHSSVIG